MQIIAAIITLVAILTLTLLFLSLQINIQSSLGLLQKMTSVAEQHIPFANRLSKSDVVECIDTLRAKSEAKIAALRDNNSVMPEASLQVKQPPLHIAFIGDSRIRQFFFTFMLVSLHQAIFQHNGNRFLQTFPQHDFKMMPKTSDLQTDRQMKSEFLNLLVTFWWRPNVLGKLGDNLTATVINWIFSPKKRPHFVIIGMALHDMLGENGADHRLYREALLKLCPLLHELGNNSRVLWLSVHPTYDTVGESWKSTELYSGKIHRYNEIARETIKGTNVLFWESPIMVAAEYIRACAANLKDEGGDLWGISSYMKCQDSLHHGSVILLETTQIFLSVICNA